MSSISQYYIEIRYSQALKINRICSEDFSVDLRCNELEEWLVKTNYDPTAVSKQILNVRTFCRDTSLDKVKEVKSNNIHIFTLSYQPSIQNFQNVLIEVHIFLTLSKDHRKVFGDNPPMRGCRKLKSLEDHRVSAKIKCAPFCRSRCQICSFIEENKKFQNKDKKYTFDTRKEILNHRSKLVVSLIKCKSYSKQYVGSATTSFYDSVNNYKSEARKVSKVYLKKM